MTGHAHHRGSGRARCRTARGKGPSSLSRYGFLRRENTNQHVNTGTRSDHEKAHRQGEETQLC
eukprot:2035144-Rhodomonas_salina.2